MMILAERKYSQFEHRFTIHITRSAHVDFTDQLTVWFTNKMPKRTKCFFVMMWSLCWWPVQWKGPWWEVTPMIFQGNIWQISRLFMTWWPQHHDLNHERTLISVRRDFVGNTLNFECYQCKRGLLMMLGFHWWPISLYMIPHPNEHMT